MISNKASIHPSAQIDEGVTVEDFAVIGAGVSIGKGTVVNHHAVIKGTTIIGEDNKIYQFSSVGEDCQDKKYAGEDTRLEIGDRNVIREFVTIHRGTVQDQGLTRIGNDNLLMAYTHVAHDCILGDHIIMSNAASLGGHVKVQDWAILSGFSMVHQFCHIGCHSFAGMGSVIAKDIPPYMLVNGRPAKPSGINKEGLKRRGFSEQAIAGLKEAYKLIYMRQLKLTEAQQQIAEMSPDKPELKILSDFLLNSERSIVR